MSNKKWQRCVAHVDMQAFFPSCEKIDFPDLKDKPVAVVNGSAGTTIISACYICREYGVKTGTKIKDAKNLIPNIIIRPSRPERYAEISATIITTLRNITPDIEVFSIDECWMDLYPVLDLYKGVENIANLIRKNIYEVTGGIVCSIGISEGKLTSKLCGGLNKGKTTIIHQDDIKRFISDKPVSKICGIGQKLTNYLHSKNIYYCRDIQSLSQTQQELLKTKVGTRLISTINGYDPERVVLEETKPKSVGHSKVLPPATKNGEIISAVLQQLAHRLAKRLRAQNIKTNNLIISLSGYTTKIKKEYLFDNPTNLDMYFVNSINKHMDMWRGEALYKVGINCTNLAYDDFGQQSLFESNKTNEKQEKLTKALDNINQKYGKNTCRYANDIKTDSLNMVPVISFNFDATSKKKNSL